MRPSPVGMRCPECAPASKFALADDMIVTKAIIGLCIAVYVLGVILQLGGGGGVDLFGGGGDLTTKGGLIVYGVDVTGYIGGVPQTDVLGVADGEWYRLITSGFLHAGLLHIGFNMYFIWMFGQLLEPALGRLRYGLLYVVGLLGGSIGAMLLSDTNTLTVGASGAAFALLGTALVMARLRGHKQLEGNLLGVAAINFALSFAIAGISIGGHAGGFVVGLIAGYAAFGPLKRQPQALTAALAVFAVALFIAGIVVADLRSPVHSAAAALWSVFA